MHRALQTRTCPNSKDIVAHAYPEIHPTSLTCPLRDNAAVFYDLKLLNNHILQHILSFQRLFSCKLCRTGPAEHNGQARPIPPSSHSPAVQGIWTRKFLADPRGFLASRHTSQGTEASGQRWEAWKWEQGKGQRQGPAHRSGMEEGHHQGSPQHYPEDEEAISCHIADVHRENIPHPCAKRCCWEGEMGQVYRSEQNQEEASRGGGATVQVQESLFGRWARLGSGRFFCGSRGWQLPSPLVERVFWLTV